MSRTRGSIRGFAMQRSVGRVAIAEPARAPAVTSTPSVGVVPHITQRRRIWRRLRRHRLAMAGLVFLGLLVACAVGADVISPYPPLQQAMTERLRPPSVSHWLGTDDFGRDILTRILFGSRISLQVGF